MIALALQDGDCISNCEKLEFFFASFFVVHNETQTVAEEGD